MSPAKVVRTESQGESTDLWVDEYVSLLYYYYQMYSEIAVSNTLEIGILNSKFTIQEVKGAIDYLRKNKAPGCDNIPAEFIEFCKEGVAGNINIVLNYITEFRDFPEIWGIAICRAKEML